MIDYKENWKKRLTYVLFGIISFYFGFIPIHIILQIIFPANSAVMWVTFGFSFLRFAMLGIFLYMAFVHVKPSFIPKQKRYRRLIILILLLIPILTILLPSGYIVPQWESGFFIVSSGIMTKDGIEHKGSTTSFGASSESDCIESCKNISNVSSDRGNSCEFTGMYGKTHWQKTSRDFIDVNERIHFGGVK
ncbi:hypothetical protein [Nitrosopumilus ureiphilus]|uniref:Uncharacterized protein n=1 Tax=Nitrosopumilus ureiphilus TaxID=1470067 RepID=A0A7D5RCT7_9ARCH|nr:hypothetical protein [Nitrosopumilus ureiphilus]QLH05943.1 hypothetical protein C5F50_01755 [Nitrosopumilus ureiphilus]